MATINKLLEKMSQQNAECMVLCNKAPIRLFVAGKQATGPVLPTAQLRSMIQEVTPPQLRAQLTHKSTFQFLHQSPSGAFDFNVINGNGNLQVTVTPQTATAARAVDLDNLDFTFDALAQVTTQQAAHDSPAEMTVKVGATSERTGQAQGTKSSTGLPPEPPAQTTPQTYYPQFHSEPEICWFCKQNVSSEPYIIKMHKSSQIREISIPRCPSCSSRQSSIGCLCVGGGCGGSLLMLFIVMVYVVPIATGHLPSRLFTLLTLPFVFAPMLLFLIGEDKRYQQHPRYREAVKEGFTEGSTST